MKILHIMAGRGLGGAETYSTDVMLSLHQAGVDQCVVMAKDAPRFEELKAAGIRMAPEVLAPPFGFLKRMRMRDLISREKPDIVHCWMRRGASLVPGNLVQQGRTSSSPLGGRLGGGSVKQEPPHQQKLRLAEEGKPKFLRPLPQGERSIPVIGWFGGYYDPAHFKRCSHFVGVTKDIVAHMVREGVPAANAFYIPTFPDIRDMPPVNRASLNTPQDAKVLLTLSRLHPKKGLDVFLQALAGLPDCIGWIAGEGPLRGELEKLAIKLNVQNRVRFLGWRTDRAALLKSADICVLPSRYEPFGTVILEAWAAKTPLVAAASAGPAAHVVDGVNGMLVPIDDAAALKDAMRRVLDNATLRQTLIAEGYAAYIANYTREAVTQKWLDFYQSLLTRETA